jgi:hypothetical protein
LAKREHQIHVYAVKGVLDAIVGGLLTLSGLALVVLEVLILIGVVQVPTVRDLLQAPNVWDVLILLLDRAEWLVVVGLLLIYGGVRILGMQLLNVGRS